MLWEESFWSKHRLIVLLSYSESYWIGLSPALLLIRIDSDSSAYLTELCKILPSLDCGEQLPNVSNLHFDILALLPRLMISESFRQAIRWLIRMLQWFPVNITPCNLILSFSTNFEGKVPSSFLETESATFLSLKVSLPCFEKMISYETSSSFFTCE